MARRHVFTIKKIYEQRGRSWKYHYDNRDLARQLCKAGWDGALIEQTLRQELPEPKLQIDATLLDTPLDIRRKHYSHLESRFQLRNNDLLCRWYWTEQSWQEFVQAFQALPEIFEDYYLKYDPEPNDRGVLVPMSSKPKQVHPSCRPVDNSGTSSPQKVHLPHFVEL
jgi:hypothetical protein